MRWENKYQYRSKGNVTGLSVWSYISNTGSIVFTAKPKEIGAKEIKYRIAKGLRKSFPKRIEVAFFYGRNHPKN